MGKRVMDIKASINEHTLTLCKLAHEKLTLLARCDAIEKEMIHYSAVINSLEHVLANTHKDVETKPHKRNRRKSPCQVIRF